MMHKTRPHAAVRSTPRFVTLERERRIKAKQLTKEQAENLEKADEQTKADKARLALEKSAGDSESTSGDTKVDDETSVPTPVIEKVVVEAEAGPDASPRPDPSPSVLPTPLSPPPEKDGDLEESHITAHTKSIEPTDSIVLVDEA